jgi:hypothetical protein
VSKYVTVNPSIHVSKDFYAREFDDFASGIGRDSDSDIIDLLSISLKLSDTLLQTNPFVIFLFNNQLELDLYIYTRSHGNKHDLLTYAVGVGASNLKNDEFPGSLFMVRSNQ